MFISRRTLLTDRASTILFYTMISPGLELFLLSPDRLEVLNQGETKITAYFGRLVFVLAWFQFHFYGYKWWVIFHFHSFVSFPVLTFFSFPSRLTIFSFCLPIHETHYRTRSSCVEFFESSSWFLWFMKKN